MSSNLILVDTSVFVDFLRPIDNPDTKQIKSRKLFIEILEEEKIVLSSFVRLELLQGVRTNERRALAELLDVLPAIPVKPDLFNLAENLLPTVRSQGLTVGLVDYLLLIQALAAELKFYTLDRPLKSLADKLGVRLV
jgi:predicted nucleic acid-binding protein